ncbi:hypothetical protein JCM3770_005499 [Rhodotorula araucariae]
MLLLPPKTLLALCVLAILSAQSAVASSLPASRQRRAPAPLPNPKAANAASHLSRPSRYFIAPALDSSSSRTAAPAGAGADTRDDDAALARQRGVAFRSAKLRAAVGASTDRLRRKRAAISAAAHVHDARVPAAGHARRTVRWARVATPDGVRERGSSATSERGTDDARVRASRARTHMAKRAGEGAVGAARRMEIRMKRMVPLFKEM